MSPIHGLSSMLENNTEVIIFDDDVDPFALGEALRRLKLSYQLKSPKYEMLYIYHPNAVCEGNPCDYCGMVWHDEY